MKKLSAMVIAALIVVSAWNFGTVFAELTSVTIKGASAVQAATVNEYTITINATGFNFVAIATSSGAFETASVDCNASGSENGSLKSTVKFSVTVKADALPGDKGYIKIIGEGCSIDANNVPVNEFTISKTLEVTVTLAPEATPTPTPGKKPKATPTATPTPTSTPTPTPTPTPTEWKLALLEIESMPQGGVLTISVSDTSMTSAALSALRDKQGILTLDFGSYSCTIDGSALGDVSDEPIDLGMTMTREEGLSANAQGKDIYQLHFAYSGDLPGTFQFTFQATGNQPGDTLYLYFYYDTARVAEGVQSSVVDEDGNVTFGIYHCSDYFVTAEVMEGAAGLMVVSTPEPTPVTPSPVPVASPKDTYEIGIGTLITVAFITALLSVFATLFIFRVGVFRKK